MRQHWQAYWRPLVTPSLPTIDTNSTYVGCFQGGVTSSSVLLSIKLSAASKNLRVAYSKNNDLSSCSYTKQVQTDAYGWGKILVSSLEPNTTYYWSALNDGMRSATICSFKTLATVYSAFKIAAASCAQSNSNHAVFASIKNESPVLFQHMGDAHYADIATDDTSLFRIQYENLLSLANQKDLYQNIPLNYMWDDHDYGPNNSSASSPSRPAARSAYRNFIPSPVLASPSGGAIYYSYGIGNILFVVTDNRSERSDPGDTDNASKTVLGTEQKTWFKAQLLAAKDNGYRGIVWVNSFPWLGSAFSDDEWAFYSIERTELSNYVKQNQIPLLAIISGDAHMIAIDNGSANEIYGVPTFQLAALDQTGSVKGAGYSHGTFSGGGQYGILEFTNAASYLQLLGTGKNSSGATISKHKTFATNWLALNDCYGRSSGVAGVTNLGYSTSSTSVTLVDYKTRNNLAISISCTSATGFIDPSFTFSPVLAHLTELHDRFKNTVSPQYSVHEVNSSSSYVITLTGLNTGKYYLIEGSSDRGEPNYSNQRGVTITINNYSELTNLSTTGIVVNSVNSVSYPSGYNTVNGYVARWIIKPSSSTVTIVSTYDSVNYPTGSKGYPVKFLCIGELL